MKKACLAMMLWGLGWAVQAQYVPDRLNYQAVLTDYQGHPKSFVTNTIRCRIYDEAEGGNLIWSESHVVTTSVQGVFNVVLGTGAPLGEDTQAANLRAAFASANLVDQRYLELQALNADGSTQSPMLPRQRFLSVPYVFQANDAQTAAGDFHIAGALYSAQEGTRVGTLMMTNRLGALSTAGDLKVDGYGKAGITATIGSNTTVLAGAPDSVRIRGDLTVNQNWIVGGTGVFYQALTAQSPLLKQGLRVKGGLQTMGGYKCLGTNLSSLATNKAAGDGFALIYYKVDSWDDDADLIISINRTTQIHLVHHPSSEGEVKRDLHFYSAHTIPIAKNDTWAISFGSGTHSHSHFDAYWISFGY